MSFRRSALIARWTGVTGIQTGPLVNIEHMGGRARVEFRLTNLVAGSVTVDCEDAYDGTNFAQWQTSGAQAATIARREPTTATTVPAVCAPFVRGRITAITGTWDVEVWVATEGD